MPALFESQTLQIVRDSIESLRSEEEWDRQRGLEELDNYYMGGKSVLRYLEKNEGESDANWALRQRNFATANYVALFANMLLDDSFGKDCERTLANVTDAQAEALEGIWDGNEISLLQEEYGQQVIVDGDGWVNVDWDDVEDRVILHAVHPGDIRFWVDAKNPRRLTRVVERVLVDRTKNDEPIYHAWIWTDESRIYVDEDMEIIASETGDGINRFRTIPYVRYKGRSLPGIVDGASYIRDQITLQKRLIQLISELGLLIKYQSGSLFVTTGYDKKSVGVGPTSWLNIENPDGNAYFATPDAKIAEVIEALKHNVEMMFETGGVPVSVIEGSVQESGIALEIKFRPFTRQIQRILRRARPSDKRLTRLVCIVHNAFRGKVALPQDPEPVVEYDTQILPTDATREREQDLADVREGLRTVRDYVERWVLPEATPEQVDEYMAELSAQSQTKSRQEAEALSGIVGVGTGAELLGPEGEI